MEREKIVEILEKHKKWIYNEDGGERADLYGADLRGADLRGANLRGADLYYADLRGANLREANLREANLYGANLRGANLCYANLCSADLRGANLYYADLYKANLYYADLRGANLREANLREANLYGANLYYADLRGANLREANLYGAQNVPFIPYACPDFGSFIGYKKANNLIVQLEILEDAQRLSSTGRKCRCNKAKVLRIENLDGSISVKKSVRSNHDINFVYTVGEIVEVADFDTNRWNECSTGIHFFINRQEAVDYQC